MRNNKGFTLLELLGVIVVIAIVLITAIPLITSLMGGSKEKAWSNSAKMLAKTITTNAEALSPKTGKAKYTVGEFCTNTSKLSEISEVNSMSVTCSNNNFVLTGTGRFNGFNALIGCRDTKCEVKAINMEPEKEYAGVYDSNGDMVENWDDFVAYTGYDVTKDETKLYYQGDNGIYYQYYRYSNNNWSWTMIPAISESLSNIPDNMLIKILSNEKYKNVTTVVLPDGIEDIGDGAFCGTQLTSVVLPSSVKTIGAHAFGYSKIKSIKIPQGVTSMDSHVFAHCSNLKEIDLYNTKMTSISDGAFKECTNLTKVSLPKNLTVIQGSAFSATGLIVVEIPNTVTRIVSSAFYASYRLSNVFLSSNLSTIGYSAFADTNIRNVTIPASVTSIGSNPFSTPTGIDNVVVDPNNKKYDSRDNCNCIVEKATNRLVTASNSTIIPSGIKEIGKYAFKNSTASEVLIPNGVETIGEYAFYGAKISDIVIPSSVTNIGESSFSESNLASATFENPNGWQIVNSNSSSSPYQSITISNSTSALEYLKNYYILKRSD